MDQGEEILKIIDHDKDEFTFVKVDLVDLRAIIEMAKKYYKDISFIWVKDLILKLKNKYIEKRMEMIRKDPERYKQFNLELLLNEF